MNADGGDAPQADRGGRGAGFGVNDDPAAYLDLVDPALVTYLDERGEISPAAVRHVQCYALALVQGLVVPEQVHEDCPHFFPLVIAFVLAYGSSRLDGLARDTAIFEGGGDDPLTQPDRVFLVTLLGEFHEVLSRTEQ
ncbi:MAG: hypothetical protein ACRDXC_01220 [Acidimicrobiales bacterium]